MSKLCWFIELVVTAFTFFTPCWVVDIPFDMAIHGSLCVVVYRIVTERNFLKCERGKKC